MHAERETKSLPKRAAVKIFPLKKKKRKKKKKKYFDLRFKLLKVIVNTINVTIYSPQEGDVLFPQTEKLV